MRKVTLTVRIMLIKMYFDCCLISSVIPHYSHTSVSKQTSPICQVINNQPPRQDLAIISNMLCNCKKHLFEQNHCIHLYLVMV